jgi:hypothetical protein
MPVEAADLERFGERLRDELIAAMRVAISESEARLGTRIDGVDTRLDTLDARIDASAAETRRHMDVVAEDLTAKIALVADGVITLTERLAAEMREGFDIVDRRLLRVESRLVARPEGD